MNSFLALLIIYFLPLAGPITGNFAESSGPKPPGQLIDLGGYKLHLWCAGEGDRTVVMSSGSGDFSFDWALVQPKVAETARVCTYDRGGEAWSDLGPSPRTMRQEAFDLRRLLEKAGKKGPYILVGQSMGGSVARVFAEQFPKDVAGVVLVDGGDDDGLLFINGKLQRLRELSKNRPVPAPRAEVVPNDRLSAEQEAGIASFVKNNDIRPEIEPPFDKLAPEVQQWRLWALGQLKHWAATDNDFGPEETQELYDRRTKSEYPLGNIPLIVLTRDKYNYPKKYAEQMEREHKAGQEALSHLSRKGQQVIVPDSGHHIQVDAPTAVIEAIQRLLAQTRPVVGTAGKSNDKVQ